MTMQRTDFPVFEAGYTRAQSDAPVLLDGMEVLFDKAVGLAPVTLVPTQAAPKREKQDRD
jgi:hypothetical protein